MAWSARTHAQSTGLAHPTAPPTSDLQTYGPSSNARLAPARYGQLRMRSVWTAAHALANAERTCLAATGGLARTGEGHGVIVHPVRAVGARHARLQALPNACTRSTHSLDRAQSGMHEGICLSESGCGMRGGERSPDVEIRVSSSCNACASAAPCSPPAAGAGLTNAASRRILTSRLLCWQQGRRTWAPPPLPTGLPPQLLPPPARAVGARAPSAPPAAQLLR